MFLKWFSSCVIKNENYEYKKLKCILLGWVSRGQFDFLNPRG
jgi:hypothetical protein